MTIDLMAAQCFLFFIAGFEGSSTTISQLLLELSRKKSLQHRLREEIVCVLQKYDGTLTYEALKDMSYLDMVVAGYFLQPVSSLQYKNLNKSNDCYFSIYRNFTAISADGIPEPAMQSEL